MAYRPRNACRFMVLILSALTLASVSAYGQNVNVDIDQEQTKEERNAEKQARKEKERAEREERKAREKAEKEARKQAKEAAEFADKAARVLEDARQALARFGQAASFTQDEIGDARGRIEDLWEKFGVYHTYDHTLAPELSLVRARAHLAKAKAGNEEAVSAWRQALALLRPVTSDKDYYSFLVEAGTGFGHVGHVAASQLFFAEARGLSQAVGGDPRLNEMELLARQLMITGANMEWRRLNEALLSLHQAAYDYSAWTSARLTLLIAESELRMQYHPDEYELRREMSVLKEEIELAVSVMGERNIPDPIERRMLDLFYALDDRFGL